MTKEMKLAVNGSPIELDYFVAGFIDHTVSGMIASLQGTGQIGGLQLSMDEAGQLDIILNNAQVPINPFVNKIMTSTLMAMLSNLKGVGEIKTLALTIKR